MKYMTVGNELEGASQLVLGCMRLAEHAPEEVVSVLETALEVGINFFDHSDVYAGASTLPPCSPKNQKILLRKTMSNTAQKL